MATEASASVICPRERRERINRPRRERGPARYRLPEDWRDYLASIL
jgi:hypothetical protein